MTVTTAYPVRVDARLDPHLSRWLWLVKWILAVPHFLVLIPLWIAFCVVSVIAFFAIMVLGAAIAMVGSRAVRDAPDRPPSFAGQSESV